MYKVRVYCNGFAIYYHEHSLLGLLRARDSLLAQMRDLNKSKPRSKSDEGLVAEITRLESSISLAKDELVRDISNFSFGHG